MLSIVFFAWHASYIDPGSVLKIQNSCLTTKISIIFGTPMRFFQKQDVNIWAI